MSKSILQIIYSCSVQKTSPKNTKYSRNESILKIGHHAKAIAHEIFENDRIFKIRHCKGYSPCKILTLAQILKFQRTCQNPFFKSFTVFLCKKPHPKNMEMFEEWEHFENRPSCKGYSPCKIHHFGSKNKIPKNMSKSILQIIYSCSVQKTAPKNTKYSRNESILKIGHHAKAIAHAKSSLWLKN